MCRGHQKCVTVARVVLGTGSRVDIDAIKSDPQIVAIATIADRPRCWRPSIWLTLGTSFACVLLTEGHVQRSLALIEFC